MDIFKQLITTRNFQNKKRANKACTQRWGFYGNFRQISTPQHFSSWTAAIRRPPQRHASRAQTASQPIMSERPILSHATKGENMYKVNRVVACCVAAILIAIVLTACGNASQPIEITRVVPQTVIVTQIVVVTSTPEPPTPTPEPSPTPAFQKWTSTDIVNIFNSADLEVEEPRTMTKDDYGMAPMSATEGTRFLIPSLCEDCGGRIFSFSNQEDLDLTKTYYEELGKSSAIFFSWVFVKDNILIQINGDLPEIKARQYEASLNSLGQ